MKMLQTFAFFSLIFVPLAAGNSIFRDGEENTLPIKHDAKWAQDVLSDSEQETASERIYKINEESDVEPGMYEGDIELPPGSDVSDDGLEKRNAQRERKYLWKDKIVPYKISDILVQEGSGAAIQAAIDEITKKTCIKWKPHQNEPNWVLFMRGGGCSSSVGKKYWRPGSQDLSLARGCIHLGVIMHEMMHAMGFWHEQSRPDRDQYVEIMWENIQPGKEHNFNKYTSKSIDYLGEVYDLGSIMHYGKYSFTIDSSKPTIQAVGDPGKQLGQRNGLSPTDIAQLNALYDCSSPSGGWSLWSEFGPCTSQCKHTRQRFCSSRDRNNCPGADSYGVQTETADCPDAKCKAPLDGHWGRWSSWSSCSVTCDSGTYTRTRKCDDPAPKNGGSACVGSSQQSGKCEMRRCGAGPYDCEFEAGGMCHWKTCAINSYPTWYRETGATGSSGTGPLSDHTSGSGNYMYFEASPPAQPGQTACFQSQELPKTACRLTFWYHMHGSGIGALKVLSEKGDGSSKTTLWSKTGQQQQQQDDPWLQASVDISASSSFKISFEATRGGDFRGDIAVDDVEFKECSENTPSPPVTSSPPCVRPVLDKCDFEDKTMCDWTNDPSNSVTRGTAYNWRVHEKTTPSSNTGPSGDHTTGQGSYIYLEGSYPQRKGVKGRLVSKQFQASSATCLHFWYHMYGEGGIGKLLVYTSDGATRAEKWTKTGDQQNEWHHQMVALTSSKPFKIIFEGVRGATWMSDIALDDIKVVKGACDAKG